MKSLPFARIAIKVHKKQGFAQTQLQASVKLIVLILTIMVPKSSSFYATTSLSSCKKSAIHYSPKKTARASNSATSFFGLESREPTTIPINETEMPITI